MDIEKEERCWFCDHSDFDPSNGELFCSATNKERVQSCPFAPEDLNLVIKIDIQTKQKEFDPWQQQLSNV